MTVVVYIDEDHTPLPAYVNKDVLDPGWYRTETEWSIERRRMLLFFRGPYPSEEAATRNLLRWDGVDIRVGDYFFG